MNAESHQQYGDLSEFVGNPHSLWPAVRIPDIPYQAEEILEHLSARDTKDLHSTA